jgi:NTE family protein
MARTRGLPCHDRMSASRTALILTGGGARAGYQAGVLKAIRELLPEPRRNPFPIICGTSAGAINAASLAVGCRGFRRAWMAAAGLGELQRASGVSCRPAGIGLSGARWLSTLALGWLTRRAPRSLLDNAPLRPAGEQPRLQPHRTRDRKRRPAFGQHHLLRLFVRQSVSFFQGRPASSLARSQRVGAPARDHARPPDGLERHPLHLSRRAYQPRMVRRRLDAPGRAGIAGDPPRRRPHPGDRRRAHGRRERCAAGGAAYPSLAQIAGHALSSIFLDSMSVDLERMSRINRTLSLIPADMRREAV